MHELFLALQCATGTMKKRHEKIDGKYPAYIHILTKLNLAYSMYNNYYGNSEGPSQHTPSTNNYNLSYLSLTIAGAIEYIGNIVVDCYRCLIHLVMPLTFIANISPPHEFVLTDVQLHSTLHA